MIADAGVDGQTVRADDLVPPVRWGGHLVHPERRARADLVAHARRDGLFGQLWQRETVHAVITRTVGDTLRSCQRSLQRREPISNGVISIIHRYLRLDVSESLQQSILFIISPFRRSEPFCRPTICG
ncbi:MAG: hypothetical protein ACUVUA_07980 [Chloroflexus sp.]|uniref:hypothetical protein n=1 Tax=Chloroflexus sp. TaxID=1904827 RepID=UPI0040492D38